MTTKVKERIDWDLDNVRCIKDENQEVFCNAIKERLENFLCRLFNEHLVDDLVSENGSEVKERKWREVSVSPDDILIKNCKKG